MSIPIISVEHLSKKYRISHQGQRAQYTTLRDVLAARSKNMLSRLKPSKAGVSTGSSTGASVEEFWALKDVSFEVQQGEVLGIIGRNGAGKSTLLKILSRITDPTEGCVRIRGRVASLLEVGTGFHPELTGRENIYLNGSILGMSRAEINRKFDEIVDFAGVEKFLDTPVKRYSSGMYVRLAFAVAAHLEPEILIVDEVLAVGDAEFQKKCLGKMQDTSRKDGRTVLFVSHNAAAIRQLTSQCLFLQSGELLFVGSTNQALERYASGVESGTEFDVDSSRRYYPTTQDARIVQFRFDRSLPQFTVNEPFTFITKIKVNKTVDGLSANLVIRSADGAAVGMAITSTLQRLTSGEVREFRGVLPYPTLAPGKYYCDVGICRGDPRFGHTDDDVVLETMQFEVLPFTRQDRTLGSWDPNWGRIIYPELLFTESSVVAHEQEHSVIF